MLLVETLAFVGITLPSTCRSSDLATGLSALATGRPFLVSTIVAAV